jgi:hypothetical protein
MVKYINDSDNAAWMPRQEYGAGGIATTGLVTGITGTTLSLYQLIKDTFGSKGINASEGMINAAVNALAPMIASRCGGCTPDALSEAQAKIAKLEAEKYTDRQVAELYRSNLAEQKEFAAYALGVERQTATNTAEIKCLKQELTTYEISQREREQLKDQLIDCKIDKVNGRVDCLADKVSDGFNMVNQALGGLKTTIGSFTTLGVKGCKIIDGNCDNCCNGNQ